MSLRPAIALADSPWPLRLAVAGVVVEVHGASHHHHAIPAHLAAFSGAVGEPRFTVHVTEGTGSGGDGDLCAHGSGWHAVLALAERRAVVSGAAPEEGLEVVLRLAMPHILHDGFLVHAALLVFGERGVLGVGPSGSGKSTLARLFPHHARGDELAAVRHDGTMWRVEAFPTPGARAGDVPLSRILFLRHGAHHRRTPIPPARAVGRLAQQVHWPTEDRRAYRCTFDAVTRAAADIPCGELAFAPHRSVRPFLAGA